ncbi:DUF4249 domain-containing protein [Flavobacterium alkalisoli]|uniref:DUF4249 domain-containing protein n=1 Tax=Flavobacterium alkalisoli TaxID=2602769 RepID=A0A5B9FVG0_9FLAO|nr:DUF4249 domain-containing protein [Flavobacterium alkalisoli]QEE50934.1 DUF4249 domain-containing protein [Flavobacterium alkalisoli]
MKNIKFILAIVTIAFFTSCEEVVDVDLETAPPRLVVDASLDWVKGTDGSEQTIRLTTTAGYYEPEVPVVSGATVFVTNSAGTIFDFVENPGTGLYNCINFEPVIGENYILTVISGGQTFKATETLYACPDITEIVQNNEGGFLGDAVEVRFFFQDNGEEDNWYLSRFDAPVIPYPDYDAIEDRFNQGNEIFNFFSDEDLEPGQVVNISLHSSSERYYNYMRQLIEIAEGGAGSGPFQVPPSTVRGNLVNQNDINNYALGYFRVTQAVKTDYTIQ